MSHVSKSNNCWEWTGCKDRQGYGRFKFQRKKAIASRVSYILFIGPIPYGICVLHHCDNPACVNPKHLWIGTMKDNSKDMKDKGRCATGKNHGSYTKPESRSFGDRNGSRTKPHKVPRGSSHGNSKISEEDVLKMRFLYKSKKHSQREIGNIFGITQSTVCRIVDGTFWKHVSTH